MTRTQFWFSGTVVLLAVAFVAWKSSRPPQVETLSVKLEDVTSTLAVSGVLESVNKSTLSSQLASALVKQVRVDIGDEVKEGDVLVVLDAADSQAQKHSADAQIQQAEMTTQLQDVTAKTAVKALALAEQGLKSVLDLRLALSVSQTNVKLAQSRLVEANINLLKVRQSSRVEQVRSARALVVKATTTQDQKARESARSRILVREGAISVAEDELAQTALATSIEDSRVAREDLRMATIPRPEDVRVAESQVAESRASLNGASQALALAQRTLDVRITHHQDVVVARGQLEAAWQNRKVAEAARLVGLAQKEAANASISKTIIRAPFDGRVSQRLVEPGQTVIAASPLLVLAGKKKLRVNLHVEESSIASLRVGATAIVSFDAFPDLQVPAVISDIGSASNYQLGTVEVRLELLKQDPRLLPELTVDANIVIASFPQVIVIPLSALMHPTQVASVYVLEAGIVRERLVKWAKGNSDTAIVRSGLSPGDQVLVVPRTAKPGSRVDSMVHRESGGK